MATVTSARSSRTQTAPGESQLPSASQPQRGGAESPPASTRKRKRPPDAAEFGRAARARTGARRPAPTTLSPSPPPDQKSRAKRRRPPSTPDAAAARAREQIKHPRALDAEALNPVCEDIEVELCAPGPMWGASRCPRAQLSNARESGRRRSSRRLLTRFRLWFSRSAWARLLGRTFAGACRVCRLLRAPMVSVWDL